MGLRQSACSLEGVVCCLWGMLAVYVFGFAAVKYWMGLRRSQGRRAEGEGTEALCESTVCRLAGELPLMMKRRLSTCSLGFYQPFSYVFALCLVVHYLLGMAVVRRWTIYYCGLRFFVVSLIRFCSVNICLAENTVGSVSCVCFCFVVVNTCLGLRRN